MKPPHHLDLLLAVLLGGLGVGVVDFIIGSVGLLAERSRRRQAQDALGKVRRFLLLLLLLLLFFFSRFYVFSELSDGQQWYG